jgi:hypothetical protein
MGIVKWAPILDELNDYRLKVTGLKGEVYEVRLNDKPVAKFGADELAKGVNLASAILGQKGQNPNPILEQVLAVKAAVEKKNQYHHDRIFRGVVLAQVAVPDWLGFKMTPQEIEQKRQAAFEERMAQMPEYDEAVRKVLEMKAHTVEVVPATK